VEALVGPDTVDTLPPATVDAVLDHGRAARTIDVELDQARQVVDELERAGISMKAVTDQLLSEGVASFHKSFVTLRDSLAKKMGARVVQGPADYRLGILAQNFNDTIAQLNHNRAIPRLWDHEPTLWSSNSEHEKIIRNALGWLDVPGQVLEDAGSLKAFAQQVFLDGFEHVAVLGMGGSSLVSDVIRHSFPTGRPGLSLWVLDSTHPLTIERLTHTLPLERTLFVVASKSGTTTEPNAYYHYFWDVLERHHIDPAPHFVAITDPDTTLEHEARQRGFRHVFLNPADIGGRYSALSWFGMVPAVLHGIDVGRLLSEAMAMRESCQEGDAAVNPGAQLGAALGSLARRGRDKVTFIMPEPISHMGDWLEQLLAESTGKLGTGLVPVAHEPLADPSIYHHDRVFVAYQWRDEKPPAIDALVEAGHPVIVLRIDDVYQLGQEFFRWEIATAIAGAVLQIDAFDQPNVQESKDNTKALLSQLDHGRLPAEALNSDHDLSWTASPSVMADTLPQTLNHLWKVAVESSYIALMTYLDETPELNDALADFRRALLAQTGHAVTLGYGPRFLHSTGQLHKGGPATGLYVQLVSAKGPKIPVPGDGYDFMTLISAQALGDFQSLIAHGRPVVRICVPEPAAKTVRTLTQWITTATEVQQ
jgi:transaldolase/glucose-6-phosphate isomerase